MSCASTGRTSKTICDYYGGITPPLEKLCIAFFARIQLTAHSKNIDISIDPFNGRNPSYCFADFHTQADADHALEVLPGKLVRNRPVKVNLKTERKPQFAARNRLPTKTYDQGWRARSIPSRNANENAYVYDRWSRDDAPSRWTAPFDEGRRLFVGGLPQIPNQDSLNAEMRTLFRGWNIEAVSKILSPNDHWRSKPGSHHYCFVDLATAQEAQDAIKALDRKATPYGGSYGVSPAKMPSSKPTKVMREQLGVQKVDDYQPSPVPPVQRGVTQFGN